MKPENIELTLEHAAKAFAVSKETLRRGLRDLDAPAGKGVKYKLATIYRALAGDLKAERTREARARADLLEMDRKEREGVLVEMEAVARMYSECLLPIRQRLLAMPSECSVLANPTDPVHARQQLSVWVDQALKQIRSELKSR